MTVYVFDRTVSIDAIRSSLSCFRYNQNVTGMRSDPTGCSGKTILLVDDEPAVLALIKQLLEHNGYTVIFADTCAQALQYAERDKESIDLLVTDVAMPGMNGIELSERVKSIIPGLKVLYTSGYTAGILMKDNTLMEGVNFIQKPFSRRALCSAVFDLLQPREDL